MLNTVPAPEAMRSLIDDFEIGQEQKKEAALKANLAMYRPLIECELARIGRLIRAEASLGREHVFFDLDQDLPPDVVLWAVKAIEQAGYSVRHSDTQTIWRGYSLRIPK